MCSGQKYLIQSPITRSRPGPTRRARARVRLLVIEDCQVGFPIRTSRDQRVLSPPPGLSQSATSFIASCCQGIHQTPLSRLIRSRRRQALLREESRSPYRFAARGQFHPQPVDLSLVGSLDPNASSSAGDAPVASFERLLLGTRQNPRSVSFDLERLLSLRTGLSARSRGARPTRRAPEQRLVYNSLHDVSGRMSPSGASVSRRLARAIGQEGSSSDEPANRIGVSSGRPLRCSRPPRILRLCRKRRWWSLPRQRRATKRSVGAAKRSLVEPTGIEPVTSCLQSTRSPS
jgi:hypothetical protein